MHLLILAQFLLTHYIGGNPALFTNEQGTWQSHPEDRKYLSRFHPCNEILILLYELVQAGKKQDLTLFIRKAEQAWLLSEGEESEALIRVAFDSLGQ